MKFEDLSQAEIMMMPDSVFGSRRWLLSDHQSGVAGGRSMSLGVAPERGVIWAVRVGWGTGTSSLSAITFRWGEVLPATAAIFAELQPVFPDWRAAGVRDSSMGMTVAGEALVLPMRFPFATGSRHLVIESFNATAALVYVEAGLLVSGWPQGEIPSWLL